MPVYQGQYAAVNTKPVGLSAGLRSSTKYRRLLDSPAGTALISLTTPIAHIKEGIPSMLLQKLFEPIEIGRLSVKNRLVMPAMHINLGSEEEGLTNQAIDFYETRARGGFRMIGVGIINDYKFDFSSPGEMLLDDK